MSLALLQALKEGVVAVERPLSVRDDLDLLSRAEEMSWDVMILLLNNIVYCGGSRSDKGITESALQLLENLRKRFARPIIAFYGHKSTVDTKDYVNAGAMICFQLPFKIADVVEALHHAAGSERQGRR
jgi:AmiR/NasT family two-component response regulator